MIPGQTTKLKDEFRCLSPDYSGPLCVSVALPNFKLFLWLNWSLKYVGLTDWTNEKLFC